MINPNKITNYNLSEAELQRQLFFWVLVAGKKAKTIVQRMKCVCNQLGDNNTKPFDLIKIISKNNKGYDWLAEILKNNGIGCQNNKARSLIELASANLDLKNCTLDELESIYGVGRKTSRCFVLHTRENAQCSGLDTHILHCLRDLGYNVPKSTPSSKKRYCEIEQIFLNLANKTPRTPASLDLLIWRVDSSHPHLKKRLVKKLLHYTGD